MRRSILFAILATCVASSAVLADGHDGDERPPMLILSPPEGADKPEGVEMTGDPREDFRTIRRVFFDMMDTDGDNQLSRDELRDWVHPPKMPGMDGDDGMHHEGGMDGDMGEHVRRLEEELRELHRERRMEHRERMREHREHVQEEMRHLREEQQRIAEHLREMQEEARRIEEEAQKMEEMGDEEMHEE